MAVAEADLRGLSQLFETPGVLRVHEQHPHDARRPGSEQRLERPVGGTDVGLPLFFDEDVLEREGAVAGQIEIAEAVAAEERGRLGADVLRHRDRVRRGQIAPDIAQPGDGLPNLTGLAEPADFQRQQMLVSPHLEFHQQIGTLIAHLGVRHLFPSLHFGKELPQPLGRQFPNLFKLSHCFTCPCCFSIC